MARRSKIQATDPDKGSSVSQADGQTKQSQAAFTVARRDGEEDKENMLDGTQPRRSSRLETATRTGKGVSLDESIEGANVRRALNGGKSNRTATAKNTAKDKETAASKNSTKVASKDTVKVARKAAGKLNGKAGKAAAKSAGKAVAKSTTNADDPSNAPEESDEEVNHAPVQSKGKKRKRVYQPPGSGLESEESDNEEQDKSAIPRTKLLIVPRETETRSESSTPRAASIREPVSVEDGEDEIQSFSSPPEPSIRKETAAGEDPSDPIHSSLPDDVALHEHSITANVNQSPAHPASKAKKNKTSHAESQSDSIHSSSPASKSPETHETSTKKGRSASVASVNPSVGRNADTRGRSKTPSTGGSNLRDNRSMSPRLSKQSARYSTTPRPREKQPSNSSSQKAAAKGQKKVSHNKNLTAVTLQFPELDDLSDHSSGESSEEENGPEAPGQAESSLVSSDVDGQQFGSDGEEDPESSGIRGRASGPTKQRRATRRILREDYPEDIKHYYRNSRGKAVPRRNPNFLKGKVNVWQYHPTYKPIFERAWVEYEFLLIKEDAIFPRPDQERKLSIKAWQRSNSFYETDYAHDKCVLDNACLITAAKAQLSYYGFVDSAARSIMSRNRKLYRLLVKKNRFLFQNPCDVNDLRVYYNQSLIIILRQAVFKKGRVGDYFQQELRDPFPLSLVSIAAAAMHNILDEYKKGYYAPLLFSANPYEQIYRKHQTTIRDLADAGPNGHAAVLRLVQHIKRDLFINLDPMDGFDLDVKPAFKNDTLIAMADAMVMSQSRLLMKIDEIYDVR
ncbi:hypothetical protein SISSUDRAFT_1031475 [Sistotremastrum suecicum HHB10207 ss-3]|uniref:DUF6532 domain-containing protein n=1 Tax=Sistotremastrum suecicum HHB10207 ss-3 TaxID=1314776 RepID=A0A166FVG2_9AGAM|nr:hypothetical protein SISSUDRAFT_1031475 [Sistotremastrum suecicum HHB10207 ss-3]